MPGPFFFECRRSPAPAKLLCSNPPDQFISTTAVSGTNGIATYSMRLRSKDPVGMYQVTAITTRREYFRYYELHGEVGGVGSCVRLKQHTTMVGGHGCEDTTSIPTCRVRLKPNTICEESVLPISSGVCVSTGGWRAQTRWKQRAENYLHPPPIALQIDHHPSQFLRRNRDGRPVALKERQHRCRPIRLLPSRKSTAWALKRYTAAVFNVTVVEDP